MPSQNPRILPLTSFFNWITSCFHPSIQTPLSITHGCSRAVPPPPVLDARLQSQCSEFNDSSECCPICLAEFTAGGVGVKVLPKCGHAFHEECIDEWLPSLSINCPVCRDQAVDERVTGNKVADETLLDPADALALTFSSIYPRCSSVMN